MRRFLVLTFLAALFVACGEQGGTRVSTLDKILARGELIVGLEAEFPPFEYRKEGGEIVGFDVDMAREIAKELGVRLRIEDLAWTPNLQAALPTGKIDVIISGMTATLDRSKRILFTDPYFETGLVLLLHRSDKTAQVKSVHDLNDPRFKVVVKTGTTGDFAAQKLVPKADLLKLPKEAICALQVSQGKVDAFIYDEFAVTKNHRRHPDTTRAILEPFTYEPYSMGVRRGDFDWWNWLNLFIRQIKKDGRYDEIYDRHLGELLGERK